MIEVILNDDLAHHIHFSKGNIVECKLVKPDIPNAPQYLKVVIKTGRGCSVDAFHYDRKSNKLDTIQDTLESLNDYTKKPQTIHYSFGQYIICNVSYCEKIED